MNNMMAIVAIWVAALVVLGAAGEAYAYVGPGSGLTLLGALWAVILAVVVSLGAILHWPLRIILRKLREKRTTGGAPGDTGGDSPDA